MEPVPYAYFKKSLSLFKEQEIQDALQSIDAAIVFSANSPFYIYQKIKLLFQLGAFETCSQLIVSQLEFLYKNASLYLLCRSIDYYEKVHNLSEEELTILLKTYHLPGCLAYEYKDLLLNPKKDLLALAKKACVQDRHQLCINYCDLLTKTKHYSPEATYMKACAYHMLGDLVTARTHYEAYLKENPTDALCHDHLGLLYMELGLFINAEQTLKKAISLDPTNADYALHLGECYYNYKQYPLAAKTYETLNKTTPDHLQTYFNLTHTYKKENKKFLYKRYAKKIKKHLKVR